MEVSLPFLFSLLFFVTIPVTASSLDDQVFYGGFKGITRNNITLDGVAQILPDGILRLTNDARRVTGHAFHASPFKFKNSINTSVLSFSSTFVFAIVPQFRNLGGHGLAFVISPNRTFASPLPSQFLGLLNNGNNGNFSNHLFAVEFDTAMDIEFRDINDNHVGIDINSLISNISVPAVYDSGHGFKNLSLNSGIRIQAWIEYDSTANTINVTISPSSKKPRSPILSHRLDLSPILQETMYVGFSASTGVLASSHDVFGWSFKINGAEAETLDLASLPSLPVPAKKRIALIASVAISSTFLIISAIIISVYLVLKIKNQDVIEDWELQAGLHLFSYEELKQATKNFRDEELLGEGGFGQVYKGKLSKSETLVAVKRICPTSLQGLREFVAEIECIGHLRHRNLVRLQGWCRRKNNLILVYDFMENGSLDKYLFNASAPRILTWRERFTIITGVASALLYLHEGYDKVVIHRDIKASNVLLDSEFNARLGDFGLAKLSERGAISSTSSRVVGTLGYIPPETLRTGKVTVASDVFAFGALLLEVSCGRRSVDHKAPADEFLLVEWILETWRREGGIVAAMDPRLEGLYCSEEAERVLKLGLMCSDDAAVRRPSMKQVVRYLAGEISLPETLRQPPKMPKSRFSEDADAAFRTSPLPLLRSL